jgi:predicted transcriptional regulator
MKRPMNDFEKNVRIALIEKGMTLKDLTEQVGISTCYIYDILSGARSAQNIRARIAEILELNDEQE